MILAGIVIGIHRMQYLALALAAFGGILAIYALGAVSAWFWAVKSLHVRPPGWITAVTAVAGTALATSLVLYGDWFMSAWTVVLFAIVVGNQLQIGPFRRRSGGGRAT